MNTILRVVSYELRNVIRNRWVLGYALLFLVTTELLLRLGGSTPRALLSLLNVVVLLIPLVTVVFGTIYWHGSREFTDYIPANSNAGTWKPTPPMFAEARSSTGCSPGSCCPFRPPSWPASAFHSCSTAAWCGIPRRCWR